MRTPAVLMVLAFVCTGAAAGQAPHNGAYLGGGFEVVGIGAAYERAYGLSLQGGYVRQYRRVGLRLGVSYFERNRLNPGGPAHARASGVSAELSYDLTTTRFRPYVLGGWGIYHLSGSYPFGSGFRYVDQLSPAMIMGIGFRYRLGGMELFSEARLHGFTNGKDWGSALMPVTFGIRFE